MSMLNSDVAKLLAPLFKKTMLDTYANPALGEPWPTNWLAAPGLPDPTIGRKRRARRARGKLRETRAQRKLYKSCLAELKQWSAQRRIKQLSVSEIVDEGLKHSLSTMPEPVLKSQPAYYSPDC